MKLPTCCGKEMKINMDLGRFLEVNCNKCGDVVYIKKVGETNRPILIDD